MAKCFVSLVMEIINGKLKQSVKSKADQLDTGIMWFFAPTIITFVLST
jgi:hypothetical protein